MKNLILILVIAVVCVQCSKQIMLQELPSKRIDTFFVTKIDSTKNNYIIDGLIGKNQKFVLISPKQKGSENCDKLTVGDKYTLNLEFETFAMGDFDGYKVDEREFPLETSIAYSPDLIGLCIIW